MLEQKKDGTGKLHGTKDNLATGQDVTSDSAHQWRIVVHLPQLGRPVKVSKSMQSLPSAV